MIKLKPFEKTDFQQLINWIKTPEFMLQWGGPEFQFPLTEKQLEEYLDEMQDEDSNVLIYSVVQKETEKVIGHISLGKIDRSNRSARIGKVLVGDELLRGKGIGEQMIRAVLQIAFEKLHLHRVSLGVFAFNEAAVACYERAGFQKEGLLRDFRKHREQYWSLWEMSILEDEWRRDAN